MGTRVVVLDDDVDLRETLADVLRVVAGASCITLGSYAELVALPAALQTELAILDINLGTDQPGGLDASLWLREQGYTGRIIFLTGHAAEHPLVQEAAQKGHAAIYAKPLPLARLVEIVGGR